MAGGAEWRAGLSGGWGCWEMAGFEARSPHRKLEFSRLCHQAEATLPFQALGFSSVLGEKKSTYVIGLEKKCMLKAISHRKRSVNDSYYLCPGGRWIGSPHESGKCCLELSH